MTATYADFLAAKRSVTTHHGPDITRDPDGLIEQVLPVALDVIVAVHDDGPGAVEQALRQVTSHRHAQALVVLLAAMVDPDRSLRETLAWLDGPARATPLRIRVPGPPPPRHRPAAAEAAVPDTQAYLELVAAENPGWSPGTLRAAHAAYVAGVRDEATHAGEKLYHQAARRCRRAKARAARDEQQDVA